MAAHVTRVQHKSHFSFIFAPDDWDQLKFKYFSIKEYLFEVFANYRDLTKIETSKD